MVAFDALATEGHDAFVDDVFNRHGDFDLVLLAFGVLGDQDEAERDTEAALAVLRTNFVGAASVALPVARRLRAQGHGTLLVLSSVAGERARRANFVYGSSKAGLDAFCQGLGDSLVGTGARVVVVRPGVRPHEDDRRPGAGAAVHHAGGGRRRRGAGPGEGRRDDLGAAAAAVRDERDAPPAPAAVAPDRRMSGEAPPLAAFDLDGTLTRRDTLLPFLHRAVGRGRTYRALLASSLPLARAAAFGGAHRDVAKAAVLRGVLAGAPLDGLAEAAEVVRRPRRGAKGCGPTCGNGSTGTGRRATSSSSSRRPPSCT